MDGAFVDYYALLQVDPGARDVELKKAFRKKSLQVHPDKRPDDPKAAAEFHELTVALEALLDKETRTAFDRVRDARLARKRKFDAQTSERRRMMDDLESREEKSRKIEQAEQELAAKIAQIKQDAERMKSRYQERRRSSLFPEAGASSPATPSAAAVPSPAVAGEDERTVRIKFRRSFTDSDMKTDLHKRMLRFGPIERLILLPSPKNRTRMTQMGLVMFSDTESAYNAVEYEYDKGDPLILSISWPHPNSCASTPAPGTPSSTSQTPVTSQNPPSFTFSPNTPSVQTNGITSKSPNYEDITLMRMREAERTRLAQSIRQEESQTDQH